MLVPFSALYSKWKKVHLGEMDFFVYLENVSMISTDSYVSGIHVGGMDFFVHLGDLDLAYKT
jgi:hypothetical protein